MYEEYLMHYGRLGMKWGQHIFGKDRSSGTRRAKRISRKQKRANAMAVRRKLEAERRKEKILSNPKLLYKHRKSFSQKEIKDAISRIRAEQELKSLSTSVLSKGEKFVNGFNKAVSTTSKTINTMKGLNKATGGVLFKWVDNELKSNDMYKTIKEQIEPFMTKPEDKKK